MWKEYGWMGLKIYLILWEIIGWVKMWGIIGNLCNLYEIFDLVFVVLFGDLVF